VKTAAFIALLERTGLTPAAAARALEISDRTMRRYFAGSSPVPRAVELALLYLVEHPGRRRA